MFKKIFGKTLKLNQAQNSLYRSFGSFSWHINEYSFSILNTKASQINIQNSNKKILIQKIQFGFSSQNLRNLKQLQKNVIQSKEGLNQLTQQNSQKHTTALYRLALGYQHSNLLQKAIQTTKQLLNVVKSITKNKQSLQIASLYKAIQILYCKSKKYSQSIPFIQNCIKIKIKIYGIDSSEVADEHQDLATIYYYLSDFQNAIKFYEIALKVRRTFHKDQDKQIKILDFLSFCYNSLKKYEQANFVLQQLQKLLLDNKKYNIVKLIGVYAKNSSIKMYLHKDGQALELLKKARSLLQSNPSQKYLQTYAFVYKELGKIYIFRKQFQNAQQSLQKQLQLINKLQSNQKKPRLLFQNASLRLRCYEEFRNHQKRKEVLEFLIKQRKKHQDFGPSLVKNLISLGKIYKYQDNIAQSKLKFAQALSLLSTAEQNPQIKFQKGDMYFQLAQINFQENNFKQSAFNYQMAKSMLESLNNQNFNYVLAEIYINLVKIQYFILKKSNTTQNMEILKKAQKIYLKNQNTVVELQIVYSMMSTILMETKKYEQSISYGTKSLQILQNHKKDEASMQYKIAKGTLLNQLGKISFELKEVVKAKRYLTQSQQILNETQKNEGFPLGEITQSCFILSQIHKQQGNMSEELKYLKKLAVLLEKNLQIHEFSQIKLQLSRVNEQIKKLEQPIT